MSRTGLSASACATSDAAPRADSHSPSGTRLEHCKICKTAEVLPWFTKSGWALDRCVSCNHSFLNPVPTPATLRSVYNGAGVGKFVLFQRFACEDPAAPTGYRLDPAFFQRYEGPLREIESHCRPGRLLDIGCGIGGLVACAARRGWNATGVDLDHEAVEFGRRQFGVPLAVAGVENLPYPAASFQAVVMLHTLEHLPDPWGALREVRRVCAPRAVLLIQVPYKQSANARREGPGWSYYTFPVHTDMYSMDSLHLLLIGCGFVAAKIWAWRDMLNCVARAAGDAMEASQP